MDRRVTPPKRVTSPIWGTPPPCKQGLNVSSASWPLNRGETNRTLDHWVGQNVASAAYENRGLMSYSFLEGGLMGFFTGAFSSNSHLDIRED